ncbi:hypothetical protein BD309DRAFT_966837 [Dichomitus squalens]|uniref:Uncharacterized protein n=1 Tax=Dichomitus squalens TaxID=114155 RepID=A0A4Q9PII7_9APHY|nr:hypothetical protein BD309DRAFT_966837 [Dichomitus squalens]TBU53576.1 hypothetical protein BD310DRAFT_937720 [Dichomitus squalens]
MPPQRSKLRRTATLTGSFYDKSGAIGESALPSPTTTGFRDRDRDADMMSETTSTRGGDDSDDEYCLTGYGEMSTDEPFTLPPSPTQTIKYRYRAYRPKLARISKKYRAAANGGTGKTKSSAYHKSDYSSALSPYLDALAGRSPKRDFQALLQKYRDSAEGWRDSDTFSSPRKMYSSDKAWSPASTPSKTPASTPLRREGSRLGRAAF